MSIKQAWWKEIFDENFLGEHPKIKGVCFFEFIKFEEESWRDFSTFGGDQNMVSPLGNDGTSQAQLVLKAFQDDLKSGMGDMMLWANKTKPPSKITTDPTVIVPKETNNAVIAEWLDAFLAALFSWAIFV